MAHTPRSQTGSWGGSSGRHRRLVWASLVVVIVVLMLGSPSLGGLGVSGGRSPSPAAASSFQVSFSAQGLAPGTLWQVTLAHVAKSSTTATINFTELNGTYPFTVPAISGYGTEPPSGSVTVSGTASTVGVSFTPIAVTDVPVGTRPFAVVADPLTGEVITTNAGSNNVSFVDAATGHLVATVTVGSSPSSVTVDAATGAVFVTNSGSGTVSVIDGATHRNLATVPVGNHPIAVTVDPVHGLVYVANELSANVTVFNATTYREVASVPVGSEPVTLAVASLSDEVYVANAGSDTVSIINGSSETVTATVEVGNEPFAIGVDAPTGEVFVANVRSNNLSVISIASHRRVASLSVGSEPGYGPSALAVDPVNGLVYVADFNASSVSVIDPTSLVDVTNVTVGLFPIALGVDPVSGDVYVANEGSANVSVVDSVTNAVAGIVPTARYPLALEIVPGSSARVAVADYGQDQLSIFAPLAGTPRYAVAFSEVGLPTGTAWSVELGNRTMSATGSSFTFPEPNGTFGYRIVDVPGWHQTTVPYSGTITVRGSAVTVPTLGFQVASYPVEFNEAGLPSGTSWSVTLHGATESSTGSTISFPEPNGTYAYSVGSVSGYTTSPSSGSVTVNGGSVPTSITFTAVPPTTYTVTFTESGLPSGTEWNVTVNGVTEHSTTGTIAFTEPNGSYSFSVDSPGWQPSSPTGTVTVNGASPSAVAITFTRVSYTVAFTESGLPSGTTWAVTLNGVTENSTTSTIGFSEPNGTYPFTVGSVSGYAPRSSAGTVTVVGSAVRQAVTFARVIYAVTFSESGLPLGARWSVTLNGITNGSTTATITFIGPNGTYPFAVSAPGWRPTPGSGNVTVNGAAVSVSVTFAQVTYAVTFTESGLPSGTSWSVTVNGSQQSSTSSSIRFTEPNGTFSFTAVSRGYQPTPASGTVTVDGGAASQRVSFAEVTYAVTVVETGLPSGTEWWVNVTGGPSFSLTTASITFSEPNGSYVYAVATVDKTYAASGGSFSVNGAAVMVSVPFARVTYAVTFAETGLPSGTEWWVNLTSGPSFASAAGSMTFSEPNGSYFYTVTTANKSYRTPSGAFAVSGAAISESATFVLVTYPVTFTESGLPAGTSWSVTLNGVTHTATTTSLRFSEPNGTYAYAIAPIAGYSTAHSGSVKVSGNSPTVSVRFTLVTYSVTFEESGVPPGTSWNVTLNGMTNSSTMGTITFSEPNGSYSYRVSSPGWQPSPATGPLAVNGAAVSRAITFTQVSYTVTFTESGLPAGTTWSVSLAGGTQSSTGNAITFREPNGTLAYRVGAVSGYTVSPSSGTVSVAGSATGVALAFTPPGGSGSSGGFLGLPGATGYYLLGGTIAAAIVIAISVAFLVRRRPT